MRNTSERDEGREARHGAERLREKRAALIDLVGGRLVLRWHTAHGIGDGAFCEGQAVLRLRGIGSLCETETSERLIKEIAGVIAGEGTPGPVRAAHTRCETDNQEAAERVPECWNRRIMPARFTLSQHVAQIRETGTLGAV